MIFLVSDNLLIDASRIGQEEVDLPEVKTSAFVTTRDLFAGVFR